MANYSTGSNQMYKDYAELRPPKKKKEVYRLKIANSRGKRPVMREISKARGIINSLLVEINDCKGRDALKKCDSLLWNILCDNEEK